MNQKLCLIGFLFLSLVFMQSCTRKGSTAVTQKPKTDVQKNLEKKEAATDSKVDNPDVMDVPKDAVRRPLRSPFVKDPDTVFHLEKTACYGDCPVYTATILADGKAYFHGKRNVDKKGFYKAELTKDQVSRIDRKILGADFFEFEDRYPIDEDKIVLDLPWVYVFSEYQNKRKRIAINSAAPEALTQLVDDIDEAISNLQWKKSFSKN